MQINTIAGSVSNTVNTQKDSPKVSQSPKVKVKITSNRDTFELSTDSGGKAYFGTYSLLEEYKKNKIIDMQVGYVHKIGDIANKVVDQYYNGVISKEELKNTFNECCDMYLEMLQKSGIDSTTDQSKQRAVMKVFEEFQNGNCVSGVRECNKIGDKIALEYGYTGEYRPDYVYYDADIYYKTKSIEGDLADIINEMFQAYNLDLSVEDEIKNTKEHTARCDGGITFNGRWSMGYAECGVNICHMVSIEEEPPKGFKFFYKESKYPKGMKFSENDTTSWQKGVLLTWIGNKRIETDIPFNYSLCDGPIAEFFNAGELFSKTDGLDSGILAFLNNFNVYTRRYSCFTYHL